MYLKKVADHLISLLRLVCHAMLIASYEFYVVKKSPKRPFIFCTKNAEVDAQTPNYKLLTPDNYRGITKTTHVDRKKNR